jgi:hypothetical protein
MTRLADRQPEDLLDDYVDDLLDDDDRSAFERELQHRPALRDEITRQHRIDSTLCRAFSPPADGHLRNLVSSALSDHEGGSSSVIRFPRRRMPWALAASLLLAVAGLWMIIATVGTRHAGPDPYAIQAHRTMQQVYADELASGFEPDWVCEDDREFRSAFWLRFRQPLLLRPLPESIAALGLAYSNTITTNTMYLLADVKGQRVLVFIDKLKRDSSPPDVDDTSLYVHRRVVGDLVLYELSPLPESTVIDYFYDPDAESPADNP